MLRILGIFVVLLLALTELPHYCKGRKLPGCTPHQNVKAFKYDAIVFDFYGTLVDLFSTTTERANSLNLPKGFAGVWRLKQLTYSWLRTGVERWKITLDAMNWALAFYKRKLTKSQKNYLMNAWMRFKPYQEVESALKQMLRANRNLYIFSDGTSHMLKEGLQYAGIQKYFKKVISTEAMLAFKPSPKTFAYLQKRLCIRKAKLLFVSGNNWAAQGAKSYGFGAIWINRIGNPADYLGFKVDGTYSSLSQLVPSSPVENGRKTALHGEGSCGKFPCGKHMREVRGKRQWR